MKRLPIEEFRRTAARASLGASEAIEIGISPFHPEWIDLVSEVAHLTDQRLVRRILLPGFDIESRESTRSDTLIGRWESLMPGIHPFLEAGWEVRTAPYSRLGFIVVVDRELGLHSFPFPDRPRNPETVALPQFSVLEGARELSAYTSQFDDGWRFGAAFVPIYHRLEGLSQEAATITSALKISDGKFQDLIAWFAKHPEKMREADPRKFEELVANLFEREGFDVELTPVSRDGGRDILVSAETEVGNLLHLVECKRYAETNPIDVTLLRSLYGVVEAERATSGILVATTRFTSGAIEFVNRVPHRLATKDYDDLVRWIRKHARPSSVE